jgi:hypothetical protein
MINRNESDLRRPVIAPGSPNSQFNAPPIELSGDCRKKCFLKIYKSPFEHQNYDIKP